MSSAANNEFLDYVLDLLQAFGPVNGRRMFGGYGIFMDGVMFALIADDVLYFKVDDSTAPEFRRLGLEPFVYERQGREVALSYHRAPDSVLEDTGEMARWSELAFGSAVAAADSKKKR